MRITDLLGDETERPTGRPTGTTISPPGCATSAPATLALVVVVVSVAVVQLRHDSVPKFAHSSIA